MICNSELFNGVGCYMYCKCDVLILCPVILIHASLRMRSIKNKITNKMEYVGLKRTPMGIILEGLGQEQEAGS